MLGDSLSHSTQEQRKLPTVQDSLEHAILSKIDYIYINTAKRELEHRLTHTKKLSRNKIKTRSIARSTSSQMMREQFFQS